MAIWGQRSRALGARPMLQDVLVESGYLATAAILRPVLGITACRAGHWRRYSIKNPCLCEAHTRLSCPVRNRRSWRHEPGRCAGLTVTVCGLRSC